MKIIRNILIEMSYNGSKYHGYQVQKNALAITEVVQDVIEKILKKRENIIGCSRTDTGVHANSYFFNIKTESKIPCNKLIQVFNRALPDDIVFLSCKDVPLDFHSRYNCIGKEYIYKIYDTDLKNPFLSDLALYYPEKLDVDLLNKKAQVLVGKHDFTSFCNLNHKKGISMVKTVEYIKVYRENEFVCFKIKADGFLYNMVRIIVGTVLNDKLDINSVLLAKDRTQAGKTVPPQGLYLNRVFYD